MSRPWPPAARLPGRLAWAAFLGQIGIVGRAGRRTGEWRQQLPGPPFRCADRKQRGGRQDRCHSLARLTALSMGRTKRALHARPGTSPARRGPGAARGRRQLSELIAGEALAVDLSTGGEDASAMGRSKRGRFLRQVGWREVLVMRSWQNSKRAFWMAAPRVCASFTSVSARRWWKANHGRGAPRR
ncbi:MAG: hypothetical protein M9884_13400 [Rhodocyclaceae bacterium]|nr:hypothetical protein [Rhodocyclaceae bacterium]